jgi:penicillin-binding protein A
MSTHTSSRRPRKRRRRAIVDPRRFAPIALTALAALVAGLIVGSRHVPSQRKAVEEFAADWQRADYDAMYATLSDAARKRTSRARLERTYNQAASVLTLTKLTTGQVRDDGDAVRVPVTMDTRIFGRLRGTLVVPTGDREEGGKGIDWRSELVFPGLRRGEKLKRETDLPPRAAIEARDGTAIAKGPDRLPDAAELRARGVPDGAAVGLTGLEREFDDRLTGTPGGTLSAGNRVIARREPVAGHTVRTSIDPAVQKAAVGALAGRYGGIAAVKPETGEVLALAGIAQSAPQPPGSTFKIVTLAGVLQQHVAKRSDTFPYQTSTKLEGVEVQNANGESCGGSLESSFAHSCNSVFAPLGAKLGARRLVATAERFGFNEDPGLAGAARSTIPAAAEIGDDLAVGSSAIGQGRVLTTPLQMALIAATIGEDGKRPLPTLLKGGDTKHVQATTKPVARTIGRYMRSVVTSGTGAAAAVPGVKVAGKTGTAELRTTVKEQPPPDQAQPLTPEQLQQQAEEERKDTDAWFTAFAPMRDPRVAVAVLLVGQGAGGATAAPAAKVVLTAGLK